ncbi:MAG: hypothetical protein AB8I08_23340 [Sandaracinaceae bacterium]
MAANAEDRSPEGETRSEPSPAPRAITPRFRRIAIASTILVVGSSVFGAAISPYLLTHAPALLLLMSPEPRHVVLTAGLLPGTLVVPLVIARRVVGLMALYATGWVYGQAAVEFAERRMGRMGRFLRWVEDKLSRWGAPVVLVLPMPVVCVMAGVAGTRLRTTVFALFLGQCFWTTATFVFGEVVLDWTTPLIAFLGRHVVGATVVCALVILATQARSWFFPKAKVGSGDEEG